MLRSHRLIAGVAALFALTAAACGGGTDTTTTSASSGAGTVDDAPQSHAEPPAAPPEKATDGTADVTFAFKKLYLGDTDRGGKKSKDAWKQFGYDIDGLVSTSTSTNLCKPFKGAQPQKVYPDGVDGTDNSFGKNVLPILETLAEDASVKVNESLTTGAFTVLLSMEKLGAGADYNPVNVLLYGGAKLEKPPAFDGTDTWPVLQELLTNPEDIKSAKVRFSESYLVGNTWVSGTKGTVDLSLTLLGYNVTLSIASAVLTMELDADHKSVKNGTIAGVIPTSTLVSEIRKVAGAFNQSFCSGTSIENMVSLIEQSSDILQDGSQDPAKTCDGISVGIGFDAAAVQLGPVAPPVVVAPAPCP